MRAAAVFLALSAFVASASAGSIYRRQYPTCAQPCIANADIGTCFSDDLNCLCKSEAFITSTTQCIISSCDASDALAAEAVAQQFCETVGVTLTSTPTNQPTGSGPSSTPAPASQTSSGSSGTSPTNSPSPAAPSPSPSPSGQGSASDAMVASGVNALVALGAIGAGVFLL